MLCHVCLPADSECHVKGFDWKSEGRVIRCRADEACFVQTVLDEQPHVNYLTCGVWPDGGRAPKCRTEPTVRNCYCKENFCNSKMVQGWEPTEGSGNGSGIRAICPLLSLITLWLHTLRIRIN